MKKKSKLSSTVEETVNSLSVFQKFMCLFVILMPLLFCKWNDQSPFEMIKAYFSTLCVCTMLIWYAVTNLVKDQFPIRLNTWLYGLGIYTAVYLISFAQAGHYYSSIWGVLNLPAGSVMTVLTFVVFSFLVTQFFYHKIEIQKLAFCFVFTAFLMSLYGILQHFGGDPINWWVYTAMKSRALSTMGQSVGFGTVMGCCLPLAFAFLINSENKKLYIWSFVWACMNLGLYYSGSRLPIFGFYTVMIIFLGVLVVFRKKLTFLKWKKVGIAYTIIVITSLAYILEPSADNALRNRLEGNAVKEGYATRFITWGTAFEMFKRNPWLGVGPENFGEEFNHIQTVEQNYGESWNLIWHKAHNEFLHYLATTGAVGFAAYLALIFLMFMPVVKIMKDSEWTPEYLYSIALVGGFGFLLMTHMTAFSFVPTLMFFYLFPAMNFNFAGLGKTHEVTNKLPQWGRYLSATVVVVLLTLAFKTVLDVWLADMNYNDSRRALVGQGNFDLANELLEKAIQQNPGNAEYWCFRADIYYNFLARSLREQGAQAEQKKRQFFDEVVKSSDTCLKMDDRKSDLWRARGTLFMSLSQMVPQMLEGSLVAFKKAIEVYPNNPYNYMSVASVYRRKGRNDLAVEQLKIAISKRRDIIPAYAELLSIYYQDRRFHDIQDLVNTVRAVEILTSDFIVQMPLLSKVARDNNDPQTAKAFDEMKKTIK